MSSQDLDVHSVVIIVNIQLFIIRTNPGTDGVGGFTLGFVVPYRMKYTQKLFSNLSQIGQILGIKYQQIFIFVFQLYKLS